MLLRKHDPEKKVKEGTKARGWEEGKRRKRTRWNSGKREAEAEGERAGTLFERIQSEWNIRTRWNNAIDRLEFN